MSVGHALQTRRAMRRKMGIAEADAERVPGVDERCEICGTREDRSTPLHLDHDHTTGAFRGWLCGNCNRAIGLLREEPARLLAAVEYLR